MGMRGKAWGGGSGMGPGGAIALARVAGPVVVGMAALTAIAPPALGSAPPTAREVLVQQRSCAGCNLRGNDLSGLNLQGASLAGANLSHAVVTWADLRGADLRGADLRYAYLWGADLTGALLEGTLLCGAVMPNGTTSSVGCGAPAAPATVPLATPVVAPMTVPMGAPMAGSWAQGEVSPQAASFGPPGPQSAEAGPQRRAVPGELTLDGDRAFAAVRDRLAPGERDVWQVNAPPGRINALVLSPDLGVRLNVVSPTGQSSARFRQRRISVEVPTQGRYGLMVDNSGDLTDYQLAITFDPVLGSEPIAAAFNAPTANTPAAISPRALSLDPLTQMGQVATAIAAGQRQEWLMDGRRGSFEIKLLTTDPDLYFDLMGQDGRHLARQTRQQVVRLPADGQYRIIVTAGEGASTYELRVRRL